MSGLGGKQEGRRGARETAQSVRVAAVQAGGCEFNPQHPCETPDWWYALVSPALGRRKQKDLRDFISKSA